MKRFFFTAAILLAATLAQAQNSFVHEQSDGYVWPENPQVLAKLDQWQDLKFGVLMHWGLYSVPGIVESWNLCNEDWIVRPEGSTYEGYKQWYWGLSKVFNPINFNPEQWADVFEDAGMKYMIFTTKHHDGFCLFDSEYTDFSVAKAGPFASNPKKDVAKYIDETLRHWGVNKVYKITYACGGKDSIDAKSINDVSRKFARDVESGKLHNPKLADIVFYDVWKAMACSNEPIEADREFWIKNDLVNHDFAPEIKLNPLKKAFSKMMFFVLSKFIK